MAYRLPRMLLLSRHLRNVDHRGAMGRKHGDDKHKHEPVEPALAAEPAGDAPPEAAPASGTAVAEPLEQALQRLERELAEWKDRALRSAADFDNFRKRASREREEQYGR